MARELLEREVDAPFVETPERVFDPQVAHERSDVPVLGADVHEQCPIRAGGPRVDRTLEQLEECALAIAQLRHEQRRHSSGENSRPR